MDKPVLYLPLKGEYFDQIKAGTKTVEYRLFNPYWRKRIEGKDFEIIEITKGYPPKDDDARRMQFYWEGYEVETITHPNFGNIPVEVFAIDLSQPLELANGET